MRTRLNVEDFHKLKIATYSGLRPDSIPALFLVATIFSVIMTMVSFFGIKDNSNLINPEMWNSINYVNIGERPKNGNPYAKTILASILLGLGQV